jgi:hypothetical protein
VRDAVAVVDAQSFFLGSKEVTGALLEYPLLFLGVGLRPPGLRSTVSTIGRSIVVTGMWTLSGRVEPMRLPLHRLIEFLVAVLQAAEHLPGGDLEIQPESEDAGLADQDLRGPP